MTELVGEELVKDIKKNTALVGLPRSGKALAIDTPIPTPTGWTTMSDLKVGDIVYASDGKETKVTFVTPVMYGHKCYEVVIYNHRTLCDKIIADAEHLWVTSTRQERIHKWMCSSEYKKNNKLKRSSGQLLIYHSHKKYYEPQFSSVRTTQEIKDSLYCVGSNKGSPNPDKWKRSNHVIEISAPLQGQEKKLPIEPYVLGVWLGDGDTDGSGLTNENTEIIRNIRKLGYKVKKYDVKKRKHLRSQKWYISMRKELRLNNLLNNKHIPQIYLRASYEQRLELLQGLMDTDGCGEKKGNCGFTTTNPKIRDDMIELLSSFGFKFSCKKRLSKLYGRILGPCWVFLFFTLIPVFKLKRKLVRQKRKLHSKLQYRYIREVNEVPSVPVKCITVDSPTHCYLAGKRMIITHNTTKAKQLFNDFDEDGCAIFINSQFESYFDKKIILRTTEGFTIDDRPKTVFNLDENEQLIPLINQLFDTQKRSMEAKKIRLIIDEVYMFQECDGARKTLTKLIVDGLKWKIQTVITAHYPQMVLSSIYKNVHQYYFFKLNNALYDYFKRIWRINLFPMAGYLAVEYNYLFYDGDSFFLKDGRKIMLDNFKEGLQIQAEIRQRKKKVLPHQVLEKNYTISELINLTRQK